MNNRTELPQKWSWTTLGEVCEDPQYGWTTKAASKGEIKLLRTTDITSGRIDWTTVPFCTDSPKDQDKYLLKDNDIVISRAGSVGVSYLINSPEPAVFASYLIRFRPKINPKYVAYFLQSPGYWSAIHEQKLGIAVPNVNATKLKNIPFPLAPIDAQEKIVERIEELFSQLDAATTALKRVQANLKRYKASVLKAACEGRLVPTEAELARKEGRSYESGAELLERILKERRLRWEEEQRAKGKDPAKMKYPEPAKPDTDGLPDLPEGWVWATVEVVGDLDEQPVLTGPFGSNLGREDFIESGVPVLTIGCLTDQGISIEKAVYISIEKAKELDRYQVQEGDLLFSRMATVGRAGYVTKEFEGAIINYHLMRLRLSRKAIEPNFFIAFVRGSNTVTRYVRDVNHGATRDGINTKQLLGMPVAIPPSQEQERITQSLDERFSTIYQIERSIDFELKRIQRLRQAILLRAFEGKFNSVFTNK